ncbi:MAG: amino acid adenylation domain-containing protein, partial [Methanobrevibacter sp.]|nr:amino acid adenylation domain-containing protein [Methanobrevibacter sp.]
MQFHEIKFFFDVELVNRDYLDIIFDNVCKILDSRLDKNLNPYYLKNHDEIYRIIDVDDESCETEINSFFDFTFDVIVDVPLYRFLILKKSDKLTVLANIHSSIFNYSSINIFKDLFLNFEEFSILENLQSCFEDKKNYLNSSDFVEDCNYWSNLLDTSNHVKKYKIRSDIYHEKFLIKNRLLPAFLKRHNLSKFNFFTGIFSLYLSYINENDCCLFKMPIIDEDAVFESNMDTLVMVGYNPNETIIEFLDGISNIYEDARKHTKVDIENYIEVPFNYSICDFTRLDSEVTVKNGEGSALTFNIYEDYVDIIYNENLFSNVHIKYLSNNLENFINNVINYGNQCCDLEFLVTGNRYDFDGSFQLMASQKLVYSDEIKNEPGTKYNVPIKITLGDSYSVDQVENALIKLINIHPVLTSRIVQDNDLIAFNALPPIKKGSLEDIDSFVKPFDLNKYLSEFLIVEDEGTIILCMDFHSLIFDYYSLNTAIMDLLRILDGGDVESVDNGVLKQLSFKDVFEDSQYEESSKRFFDKLLADKDEAADLLFLKSESSSKAYFSQLDDENVDLFLKKYDLDYNQFLISVFSYTLSRFTGSSKVLFNLYRDRRNLMGLSDSIGMFFQKVPILVDCENQSIDSFMDYSKSLVDSVFEFPFNYNFNSNVLFSVLQDTNVPTKDLKATILPKDIMDKFSVIVYFNEHNRLEIRVVYSEMYSDEFVKNFVNTFNLIMQEITAVDELSEINYVSKSDLKFLNDYNKTEMPIEYDDVLDAFNDNLSKFPDNDLVSMEDRVYSYSEGAFIANEISEALKNNGVKSKDYVAFVCERSEAYLFNILSILSIGAVPVPIDDALPDERIKFMIEDSNSEVVIVSNSTYNRVNNLFDNINVLNVSTIIEGDVGNLDYLPVVYGDLAGVVYTSGTTGIPKGVKITRKAVLNLSVHYVNAQNFGKDDVYALYPSIGFDAGYKSIFKVLYAGACLVIVPEDIKLDMARLNDYFIEHDVGHVFITTQVSKLFMESVSATSLKVLSVGGEKLGEFESPKDYIVMDDYGPSEAFAFIISIDISQKMDSSSIGVLNCNSKAYILDSEGRRVPYGAVGELYLAGYQIADGYLNREEETEKSFLTNPFDDEEGYEVMYRTGDMVRFLPDGTLGFVGRRDSQVKIRGNRVELSEIESTIRQIDYIEDVTIQTVKHGSNNELVAYVVVNEKWIGDNLKNAVCEYVGKNKPDYMIPSYVIRLNEIPLNVNGKVDKSKLPEVNPDSLHTQYVAPTTETEKIIVEAFETVFDLNKLGIYDDFISLGGDSIKAIRLLAILQKNGISCTAKDILTYKTPYMIAQNVVDKIEVSYDTTEGVVDLLPVQKNFFDCINSNEYTQEFVLKTGNDVDIDIAQKALDELCNVHDMLRARYKISPEGPIQEILPLDTCVCEIEELYMGHDLNEYIKFVIHEAKRSLDISKKLMDVSLIHYSGKCYFVFVIHHLIIDGVSWSILLDDFSSIYAQLSLGKEIDIAKPYPYKLWVEDVKSNAENIDDDEKQHWVELNKLIDDSDLKGNLKPITFNVKNIGYDADILSILSEEEYFALAVARAYKKTYEQDVIFNCESYGREESLANVNGTVGWFTSQYPISADVSCNNDFVSLMSDSFKIKKAFEEIKDLGLNYLSLAYNSDEFDYNHCPITFNFLSTEFSFKNNFFESYGVQFDYSDAFEVYGSELNILRIGNDYVVKGFCAEGTYIDEKYDVFVDNIKNELRFIADYSFMDDGMACPLSESQLGIYLDEKVNDMGTAYAAARFVECDLNKSNEEIKEALLSLIDKHPILKGRVHDVEDMSLFICDSFPDIQITDNTDFLSLIKPFELDKCISRFYIVDASDKKGIFFDVHHIINDASTSSILENELAEALDGDLDDVIDLGFLYASRDSFEIQFKPVYEDAHEFFTKNLSDMSEVHGLIEDVEGSYSSVYLPIHGVRERVEEFVNSRGITVGAFLNAVFAYTYSRFTGSEKVYFNFTEHGRHEDYAQNALGMFVRTIPMLVDCKNDSIDNYLNYFSDLSLNSMFNGFYPYRLLAREFGLNNDVIFEYDYDLDDVSFVGDELIITDFDFDAVSQFACVVNDLDDGYVIHLDHTDNYSNDTCIRFAESYAQILTQMLNKDNLADINYISKSDIEILEDINQTECNLKHDDILDAFTDNLNRHPNNKLVSYNDVSYSYSEGAFIAVMIAKSLRDLGVKTQDNVAFLVERSELYMFSVLGILTLGAVYVPLDDAHPDERIEYILKDTNSKAVIVCNDTYQRAENLIGDDVSLLNISDIVEGDVGTLSILPMVYGDLACILYTSGTTGIPKGVKITRKSVLNLAMFYHDEYGLDNDDVYGLFSTIGFDAALLAVMTVLYAGACLSIVPENLRLDINALNEYFIEHGVTHTLITSQVGRMFMQYVGDTSLEVLLVGGEKLGRFESPDNYTLVDAFGPTEACVFVTSIKNVNKLDSSSIGHLIYNTKAYVLDKEKRRVPIGAVGELFVAGTPVADGYLNRDEETEKVFLDNSFDDEEGYEVMYGTGDMVRILPDESLAVIGRRDGQVKIRGNRVELSEIEAIIREIDDVYDVTVQTVKHGTNNELVAYVVVNKKLDNINKVISDYIAKYKPEYMIPSYIIELDEIPLNVNGKVDRKALPDVDVDSLHTDYVAPATKEEKIIVDAFEKVFDSKDIGIFDNFVRLGGDSIKCIRIISLLQKEGISCTAKDILNYKTPQLIALNITEDVQVSYDAVEGRVDLLPIQSYFFDQIKDNSFTQEFVLKSLIDLDIGLLQDAWRELSNVHDMLRVNYKFESGKPVQEVMPLNSQHCEISEHVILNDLDENISQIIADARNSLDISNKLVDINVIHYKNSDYVVFVIHHLIVDGVSWNNIIDDLSYIYTQLESGNEIDLARPYSYRDWTQDVHELLEDISNDEKRHWIEINALLDDSDLKGMERHYNFSIENIGYDAGNMLMLSEEECFALAIARAYKKTYGKDIIFNRESYGREESLADVNRTVGWFTSQYPVMVDVSDDYDDISLVLDAYNVKTNFKDVNNLGLNYLSLIYDADEFEFKHCPVTLNFLSTEFSFKNNLFESFEFSSHFEDDLSHKDYYGIDFNIFRMDDRYVVEGCYAEGTFIADKLGDFIENINGELKFISEYVGDNIICRLSESQLGIYLDEKVNDKGTAYSALGHVECDLNKSNDEIKEAIRAVIDKHPILKGRVLDAGDMLLWVCDASPEIEITDCDNPDTFIKPFDLEKYVSRFFIIDNGVKKSIVYDVHHIANDATSITLLNSDLEASLKGNLDKDIDLGFVYACEDSFESKFKPIYEEAHEFFAEKLADIEEVNEMLGDIEGSRSSITLPIHGVREKVEKFVSDTGITEGTFLNAAFAYTYSRFVGSDKVYFNFTEHGRHEEYLQNALGMYVRTIPMLVDCKNDSIVSYLNNFSDLSVNSMINSIYPFRLIASEFNLNNSVLFEYNFDLNDVSHVGDELVVEDFNNEVVSDLLCVVNNLDDGYVVNVKHTDKYSRDTGIRFIKAYAEVLIQMIDKKELSEIDYISESDVELLDSYNQTEHPLDYEDILDAFNDNLAENPDNPLVSFKDNSYSYGEGAFIACEISNRLRELNVAPGDNVSFLINRSENYLFSILAILSNGSVFVPLDSNHPDERLKFMVDDASSEVVIVDEDTYERAKELFSDKTLLNVSEIDKSGKLSELPVKYNDLACILYTSGTTGVPKGVKVTRRCMLNVSEDYIDKYDLKFSDVYGLFTSIGFDVSSFVICAIMCAGARLSVIPEDIRLDMSAMNDYFKEQGVTHTYITTQVGKLFMQTVDDVSLDVLVVAGEKLGEFESPSDYMLVDAYGPTEALFVTTIDNSDKVDASSVGILNYNTKAYILDSQMCRVPIGAVGELYLAGSQIAKGYLNNEEETSKAFLTNPFDDNEEYNVLYRTGDMVRILPDGSIAIVGRRDSQVKIRGNRVELSEVEDVIRGIDYIEDVTVQTVSHKGNDELVAYVVVNDSMYGEDNLIESVRSYVGDYKPDYMVPSFVIRLDKIPLNVNGKVDRRSLPDVDFESLRAEYVAPRSENERRIVEAFEKVFNQDNIGVYDDFVRLGGDSLTAIKILSYLDNSGISAADILSLHTPHEIAKNMSARSFDLDLYDLESGCPLNEAQLNVYLDIVANDKVDAYLIPLIMNISRKYSISEIQNALNTILDVHPILEMCVEDNQGVPYLIKGSKPDISVAKTADNEFLLKPFNLSESLSRFLIVENENDYTLFAVFHHIVFDALSDRVFKRDLQSILDGISVELDDSFLKMSSFNKLIPESEEYGEAENFYDSMLANCEESGVLLDSVFADGPGLYQDDLEMDFSLIKPFLDKNSISENVLFTSAFAYTLSRFVGSDKVLFNIIENGRDRFNNFNSIGMFVNTLPLAVDCKNSDISSFVNYMSDLVYDVMKYNYYPFRLLANEYNIDSSILFQFMPDWIDESGELSEYTREYDFISDANDLISDFNFDVVQKGKNYNLSIAYSDKYDNDFIVRFAESYKLILHEMISAARLDEINYITKGDVELLDGYNQTEYSFEYGDVLEAFCENLADCENNLLVGYEDKSHTYGEGAFIANEIASKLLDLDVKNQDNVALFVERSEWFLLASMGVLLINGVYVPIDVNYPDERIRFMLEDTGANVIVVSDETEKTIADICRDNNLDIEILNVSRILDSEIASLNHIDVAEFNASDIACILYTSGTTGLPKAVPITRKAVNNFVSWYVKETKFTSEDIYGMHCSYVFDIHTAALYAPIITGGSLFVVPEDIRLDLKALNEYYVEHGCTHTYITSQVGKLFAESGMETTIKLLCFGGMKLGELNAPDSIGPFETYGPSENLAVSTSIFANKRIQSSSVGHFISNVKGYVLDNEHRRIPIGAVGELYLSGAQLTPGYLNRPEENAKSFFKNTFDDVEGYNQLYATGDLVRFLPDGSLSFIGRRDSQVKIRGNRVELWEVEDVIRNIDYIKDVTVQTVAHNDNNELVAYVVVNEEEYGGDNLIESVRGYVGDYKPDYMVPSFVIKLDEIPLNVNGKVDRRALPEIDFESLRAEYVAPRSENERMIVEAFEKVFNQDNISIYDDFIHLGGDSLTAIKLLSHLDNPGITAANILSLHTPYAIAKNIGVNSFDLDLYDLESGCPLNEAQLNVYLDIIANDKVDAYLIPLIMDISKEYSIVEIQDALDGILKVHPILVMCVDDENEVPYLVRGSEPDISVKKDVGDEVIDTFLSKPFDLSDSLSRFLIAENEDNYTLFASFHHIIFDALSDAVFKKDLQSILDGKEVELDDSFMKVSAFDKVIQESADYAEAKNFYDSILVDSDEVGVLLDSVLADGPGVCHSELEMDFNSFTTFLDKNGISENVLFTSVFAYTLSRFVGSDKVLFNIAENGRDRFNNYDSIGMYVNTLPMLADCKNQEISVFMDYMSDLVYKVMSYNYYPFRLLSNEYDIDSRIFFQFMPEWINIEDDELAEQGFSYADFMEGQKDFISDFSVEVVQDGESYALNVAYSDKYSTDIVKRFIEAYKLILSQFIDVDRLSDINFISDSDLQILESYNETEHPLDYEDILDAFNYNLGNYRDNPLVSCNGRVYSYGEGAFIADKIAGKLKEFDVESQDKVAFLVERSELYMFSVLGILSAGAVYVPLDDMLPDERLEFILKDTDVKTVIVDDSTCERAGKLTDNVEILNVSDILKDDIETMDELTAEYGDLACILYTSGTTGLPKGVEVTRKSILNLSDDYLKDTGFDESDVYALFAGIGFDAASQAICQTFYAGACLSVVPEDIKLNMWELNRYFINESVSHTMITTQVAKLFMQNVDSTSLDVLTVGGEKLGEFESPEGYTLIDAYGPTETFAYISSIRNSDKIIPSSIGKWNFNTKIYVLDPELRKVPVGAVGELYIAGYQVAGGYLNNDEENSKSFFNNPFEDDDYYSRLYRTGDMVRLLPDGSLEILGRGDSQVKIRGNRVELFEIEAVIREIDLIDDVTVQTVKNGTNNELVAYVVASDELDDNAISGIVQDYVGKYKPDYMVPSFVVSLESIPLTVNYKVDKDALPEVNLDTLRAEYVAPSSENEKLIVDAFETLFNQKIGIYDDFVRLGGDSLTAIKLLSYLDNPGITAANILSLRTPYAIAKSIGVNSFDLDLYDLESGCPLNEAQLNVYLDVITNDKSGAYIIPLIMDISKEYDIEKILNTLDKILKAHPIIGMCVSNENEVPYLVKGSKPSISVEEHFEEEFITKPFDLHDSLSRFLIVEDDAKYRLFAVFHHIIFDALSGDVFKKDLQAILDGNTIETEDSFLTVSAFSQNIQNSSDFVDAGNFYDAMLVDSDECGTLLDCMLSDGSGELNRNLEFDFDIFKSFLNKHGISENVLFTGVFAYTLSRFVGSDKVLFNITENGRDRFNNYSSIGMFVNTLPMLVDCKTCDIGSFIDYMSDIVYKVMEYNYYPFRLLSKKYDVDSEIIFQFMPEWIGSEDEGSFSEIDLDYDNLSGQMADLINDLTVEVIQNGNDYQLFAIYSDKYSNEFIERFMDSYNEILSQIISADDLSEIDYVSKGDLELLDSINSTESSLAYDDILDAFNSHLAEAPDNKLVFYNDNSYSYGQGAFVADKIAQCLKDLDVKGQDNVAFLVERSELYMLCVLGILSIGAVYVPLDDALPDERIKFILGDASSKAVIVSDETYKRALNLADDIKILNISDILKEDVGTLSELSVEYGDLACILYTSGSTGVPKGVKVTRQAILNTSSVNVKKYGIGSDDVYGMFTSIGFDIASLGLCTTVCAGASLTVIPEDIKFDILKLNEYIFDNKITFSAITAPVVKLFMQNADSTFLKGLSTGGEKLGEITNPLCQLMDEFGPTETFGFISYIDYRDKIDSSSVGFISENTKIYILDSELRRVPYGAVGELYIAG